MNASTRRCVSFAASVLLLVPLTPATGPPVDVWASQADAGSIRFDAASVKQSPPDALERGVDYRFEGERWRVAGFTLIGVLRRLYPEYAAPGRIVGGPGWVTSQRFDITATAGRQLSSQEQIAAARRVLIERFGLTLGQETRDLPGFVLSIAQPGRAAPSFRTSTSSCTRPVPGVVAPPGSCRSILNQNPTLTQAHVEKWSVAEIVQQLQRWIGPTPLEDRTELTGFYDFDLQFATATVNGSPNPDPNSAAVDFVTALREQLGLRLTRQSVSVPVLVIESATAPIPN